MRFGVYLFLAVALAPLLRAAPPPRWQAMPAEKFWKLPEVNARIDFATYDRGLMAAAIFHESNRARQEFHQRRFRHLPELDEAADLQAGIGAILPGISHHSPLRGVEDVADRVHSTGLRTKLVAENLALSCVLDADPKAGSLGVKTENDVKFFYDPATGRQLQPLTYAGFAKVVVQQWLDSPGHRANLLNPKLECLGCSARWRKDYSGADLLYSAQAFATLDGDQSLR